MKNFDTRNFETQNGFLTNFIGTVKQKFQRGIVMSPSYASTFLFDTRNFSRQRRVPLRNFSALKQNSTENNDILFLCLNLFRYPKFSDSLKHRWVTLRSYSVRSCEIKFSTEPLPNPTSSYPKTFFLYQKFSTRSFSAL